MDDASNRGDSAPACNTCQAKKRKCDGVLPRCTNCFTHDLCCSYDFTPETSHKDTKKTFEQPTRMMDGVRISMDGLTKTENLQVQQLPLGFSMYLTSETERLVRELPEEIWADIMVPEGGKGYVKTIMAPQPDVAPQPYSDPILEHNSDFNWKSLFPPECDLPESVSGAAVNGKGEHPLLEPAETQVEFQRHVASDQQHTPGSPKQEISATELSPLEPLSIYHTEEFTDSWEDAYGWLRSAMACEPFSIGHPRINGYQPEEDILIAEPHI
ncbi:hypothetical protein FGG08_000517 [Glutinoglossum americanum]|uniref:Zn(2)-C6 fungal-type domain-containing protein n=1 Tax=Glutinoglossum americanum TaxID=1670608 RepID=A0A9P8IF73_9PEZI|nr:hypothetical protein FGG08_000517 [Glutinoglossum americanum]